MAKTIITSFFGLILGAFISLLFLTYLSTVSTPPLASPLASNSPTPVAQKKEVFGFLPYWFITEFRDDHLDSISTLNYFSLTIDTDGTILKSTTPIELEPGYYALTSGIVDSIFEKARQKNIRLSLTIFSGDQEAIRQLVTDPVVNAENLITDISPILSQYGFTDLNLDIEGVGYASPQEQDNYVKFVEEVRKNLSLKNPNCSLSMDIIPIDFIRSDRLVAPARLVPYLDEIIIMAYDFHSPSSYVTGPVAPLYGAGTIAEFDTQVAVEAALKTYDAKKILLGIPFYGYSWETIDPLPRAPIIPSSALVISNKQIEEQLKTCSFCKPQYDSVAAEKYIIYKNEETGTYQQTFYPDKETTQAKINFVKGNNLGGLAIWALGYEATPSPDSLLIPIQNFVKSR